MKNYINKHEITSVARYGTDAFSGTQRYVLDLRGLGNKIDFINIKDAGTKYGNQVLKGDNEDILLLNGLSKEDVKTLDDLVSNWEITNNKSITEMTSSEFGGIDLNKLSEKTKQKGITSETDKDAYVEICKEIATGFYGDLLIAGFTDIYCSTQTYKKDQLIQAEGNMYTRTREARKVAEAPIGSVIIIRDENGDVVRSQQATEEGALLVVQLNKEGIAMDAYFSNIKDENVNRSEIEYSNISGTNITNVRKDYTPVVEGAQFITLKQAKEKDYNIVYESGKKSDFSVKKLYEMETNYYLNVGAYSGNLSKQARTEAIKKEGIVVDGYKKDAILITSEANKNGNITFTLSEMDKDGNPVPFFSMDGKLIKGYVPEITNEKLINDGKLSAYKKEDLSNIKNLVPSEYLYKILANNNQRISSMLVHKSR